MEEMSQVVRADAVAALRFELMRAMEEEIKEAAGKFYKQQLKDVRFSLETIYPMIREMGKSAIKSERPTGSRQDIAGLQCLLEKVKDYVCCRQVVQNELDYSSTLTEINEELTSFFQNWKFEKAYRALQREERPLEGHPVEHALLLISKMRAICFESITSDPENFRPVFQSLESTLDSIQQMVREMGRSDMPFAGHKDDGLFMDLLKNLKNTILRFQSGQCGDDIKRKLDLYDKRLWSFLPDDVKAQRALLPDAKHPVFIYHVFLSFRGKDTRERFACLLHDALTRAGIVTFMDDVDIKTGEDIDLSIREGIKSSMCGIIVFSEDYTSSKWVLDELLLILQRWETSAFTISPIYYGLEPADIRHQRKKIGEALENHRERHGDRVDKWRNALRKVGDLKGTVVAGKLDVFFNNVVDNIRKQLSQSENPQLGRSIQSAGLPDVLNLNPTLGHMGSSSHVRIPNLSGLQQGPQEYNSIKEPENDGATTSQPKEENATDEQVKVDPTPSNIEEASQCGQLVGVAAVVDMHEQLVIMVEEKMKEATGTYMDLFKDLDRILGSIKPMVKEMRKSERKSERPPGSNQDTAKFSRLLENVKSNISGKKVSQGEDEYTNRLNKSNEELTSYIKNWKEKKERRAWEKKGTVIAVEGIPVEEARLYLRKMRNMIFESIPGTYEPFISTFQSLDLTLASIQQKVLEMERSDVPFAGHRDAELFIDLLRKLYDYIHLFQSGHESAEIKNYIVYYDERLQNFLPDVVQA